MGERGADALAHFGACAPDFAGAVWSDFEEGVGSERVGSGASERRNGMRSDAPAMWRISGRYGELR